MKMVIITIGKIRETYIKEGESEYLKRISPFAQIKEIELKADSFDESNKDKVKKIEADRVLNSLQKFDKNNIYLLAEDGDEFDSPNFSKLLGARNEIVFVIAGALGWSSELREAGYKKLSLSRMTMPHEMARLVLLEQTYRGLTIINNKKYHY